MTASARIGKDAEISAIVKTLRTKNFRTMNLLVVCGQCLGSAGPRVIRPARVSNGRTKRNRRRGNLLGKNATATHGCSGARMSDRRRLVGRVVGLAIVVSAVALAIVVVARIVRYPESKAISSPASARA
jgi:hypothetical protein